MHPLASTDRTDAQIDLPHSFEQFRHGHTGVARPEPLVPLDGKDQLKILSFAPVIQKPVVSDLLKTLRKHMGQIAADEFRVWQGDFPPGPAGDTGTCGENHLFFADGKDPAVGNGDLMSIPSQVFERVAKTVEGLFYERAPVLPVKKIKEFFPGIGIAQVFTGGEGKGTVEIEPPEAVKEFPFKLIPKDPDRNKKVSARHTEFMICSNTAA